MWINIYAAFYYVKPFEWTLYFESYTENYTEMSAVIDAVNNISKWTFLETKQFEYGQVKYFVFIV